MFIIKHRWIFLSTSIILIIVSLVLLFTKGLKQGIDFTGGTEVTIAYHGFSSTNDGKIDLEKIKNNILDSGFQVKNIILSKIDASSTNYVDITLVGDVKKEERSAFEAAWSFNQDPHYEAKQISENVIGPSMGKELTRKAFTSIIIVAIVIILFTTYAFRQVSHPVNSFKYGLLTVVALIHDLILILGVYVILGITHGAEINSLFVLALLTVMAISMSDTIVVFDRIRENLKIKKGGESFAETVGKSLDQTLLRSFNTSLAVILVLLSLFFFGPNSIHDFSLTLIVGMIAGTYSSIFIASPLLILAQNLKKNKA